MKSILLNSVFLMASIIAIPQFAVAQFWTENFIPTNMVNDGSANGYQGTNGTWVETQLAGNTGSDANKFFISCSEAGMVANNCGGSCPPSPLPPPTPFIGQSLHIGSVPFIISPCPIGDCGASYNAGDGGLGFSDASTEVRIESPTINCNGNSDIGLSFNYIEFGDGSNDNAEVWYFDGNSWSLLLDMSKTSCGDASGGPCNVTPCGTSGATGLWTLSPMINLPASANNNPNVKIGFRWINNNDGVGTDPSFAVTSIQLNNNVSVGLQDVNLNHSLSINPNPVLNAVNLSMTSKVNDLVQIQIFNALGQLVHTEKINLNIGISNYEINITSMAAGTYTFKMLGNKINDVKYFVKN